MVLAIPLQLKGRNVYMATNFETNFYIPYFDKGQGLVPLPFAHVSWTINQIAMLIDFLSIHQLLLKLNDKKL